MKFLLLLLFVLFIPIAHAEQIQVGDITVKYKKIGQGDPILLISGTGNQLEFWPSDLIHKLSKNHTVITFDNHGIGNTTFGYKKFTMKQFALDTDLFLEKINVTKTDVLGFSLGGMIAQELALFSNKIDKLIISSSHCGGSQTTPASKEIMNILNSKLAPTEKKEKLRTIIYPKGFDFDTLPKSSEIVTDKAVAAQQNAIANWKGVCDSIKNIKLETLVIVGKQDNFTPSSNSQLISKNIKGSKLIQIDGGHPLGFTNAKYADSILFFLD
jgi:pimeloyl-ACP methyl ester carboxylesterase